MTPPGYILIRPETLVGVQKAVEAALGPAAAECVAAGGRAGGGRATAALGGDAHARVARLLAQGRDVGWGDFTLERFTQTSLSVTVTGSPFARAYGGASAPVCHLTRGVLDALAASVLDLPVTVRETACVAMGASQCRFEASTGRARTGGEMGGMPHPPHCP
jgi:predicted hydrocarbon binding protein